MKKAIFILALLFAACSISNATVRVVYNNNPSPGQFATIDAAVAASANGDTIFVQPSTIIYTAATIAKNLKIFGAGLAPEKPAPLLSSVAKITLNPGSQGSVVSGITFTQGNDCLDIFAGGNANITVSRCYFPVTVVNQNSIRLSGSMQNVTFNECFWFITGTNSGGIYFFGQTHNNFTFNNCVIYSASASGGGGFLNGGILSTGWNFNNCLFYNANSGINALVCCNNYSANFNSCIFNKAWINISNSTFTNCLTFNCNPNNPWAVNGNFDSNFAGTNLANQDPQFVNAFVQNGTSFSFVQSAFAVQATSPTLMANHPGGATYDMGPYGGSGVFTWNNAQDSNLPLIHSMIIQNPTIQSGQNLNINVISKKRN